MSKEFKITNFNQLGTLVNAENWERLSKDLTLWLQLVSKAKEDIPIKDFVFIWLDDGKHEAFIELTNKKTGEIIRLGGGSNE
jgi:hypothetical protein